MKNKHMSDIDRLTINNGLQEGLSFKAIAKKLNKDCTTISKEVRRYYCVEDNSIKGRVFNNCLHRFTCQFLCKRKVK